jgi:flagellar basal-body rod modification protein FlgD
MATAPVTAPLNAQTNQAASAPRLPRQTLDQQDFLRLLVTQLTAQDPLNPVKDTEFIAQMAQFSALEQTQALQAEVTRLRAEQQFAQAGALLGRAVTVQLSRDTAPQRGTVTDVAMLAGTPQIVIDGQAYELDKLYALSVTEKRP